MASAVAPLQTLRILHRAFFGGVVLIGLVGVVIVPTSGIDDPALPAAVAILVVLVEGLAAITLATRLQSDLRPTSADELRAMYQGRFWLRCALAESPALMGLALGFVAASAVPGLLGAALALVGLTLVAPSDRNLQREDEALALRGVPYRVSDALGG